jgi:hypothetical protein
LRSLVPFVAVLSHRPNQNGSGLAFSVLNSYHLPFDWDCPATQGHFRFAPRGAFPAIGLVREKFFFGLPPLGVARDTAAGDAEHQQGRGEGHEPEPASG